MKKYAITRNTKELNIDDRRLDQLLTQGTQWLLDNEFWDEDPKLVKIYDTLEEGRAALEQMNTTINTYRGTNGIYYIVEWFELGDFNEYEEWYFSFEVYELSKLTAYEIPGVSTGWTRITEDEAEELAQCEADSEEQNIPVFKIVNGKRVERVCVCVPDLYNITEEVDKLREEAKRFETFGEFESWVDYYEWFDQWLNDNGYGAPEEGEPYDDRQSQALDNLLEDIYISVH